jgi:hypothetical protein
MSKWGHIAGDTLVDVESHLQRHPDILTTRSFTHSSFPICSIQEIFYPQSLTITRTTDIEQITF